LITHVCAAWAFTANRLLRADFERLVNEFRSHVAAPGKVDGCCSPARNSDVWTAFLVKPDDSRIL
jgi:hypothetical protein